VPEGQTVRFRAFAFDPNNPSFVPQDRTANGDLTPLEGSQPTITYAVSGLPPGATFDPATAMFVWPTGYNDAGHDVVTFTATNDGDGTGVPKSATVSVPITIVNTNRAPQLAFIANASMDHNTILDLPIQATDPDGDPMVLSVVGLPGFAQFVDNGDGTGRFHFAPGLDDRGNYTMTVTVRDNGDGDGPGSVLSTTQSFVLTVNNPNEPPHLASIADKVAVVRQPFQLTVSANDGDQDTLSFTASGLPAGASLTPSGVYGQAVINWTPAADDVGRYTVLITVADNGNGDPTLVLKDQRTFTLAVHITN